MKFRERDWNRELAADLKALEALPGVKVTRRTALQLTGVGAITTMIGCGSSASDNGLQPTDTSTSDDLSTPDTTAPTAPDTATSEDSSQGQQPTDPQPLTLDELVEQLLPEAEDLIKAAKPWDIPYVKYCAELLSRLVISLAPLNAAKWDLKTLIEAPPIEIVELEIAPNTTIPLHDHRDYIGAILGVEGQVDCVNYTRVEGQPPAGSGSFLLQKTEQGVLMPGDTSYLGLEQHNFHVLKSGAKTARMVDVFTFFPDGVGNSYWAQVNDTPVDEEQEIYAAKWI